MNENKTERQENPRNRPRLPPADEKKSSRSKTTVSILSSSKRESKKQYNTKLLLTSELFSGLCDSQFSWQYLMAFPQAVVLHGGMQTFDSMTYRVKFLLSSMNHLIQRQKVITKKQTIIQSLDYCCRKQRFSCQACHCIGIARWDKAENSLLLSKDTELSKDKKFCNFC